MPDSATEQIIISSALVDPKKRKILVGILSKDFFFTKTHPEAWAFVEELDRRSLSFDPLTCKQLTGDADLATYLDDLVQQRPVAAPNLDHHVATLRWDKARIDAIKGPLGGLVEAIADPLSAPEKVLSLARSTVASFEGHGSLKYLRDPDRLIDEMMSDIESREGGAMRFPWGIPGFDDYTDGEFEGQPRLTWGAVPGFLTVITGASGGGKSTFTARLAVEQANQERKVIYAAWEMGARITLELCASVSLGVSRSALLGGYASAETKQRIRVEAKRLSEFIRFFDVPFDRGRMEKGRPYELNERHIDTIFEYLVATAPDVTVFDLWRQGMVDQDPSTESRNLSRLLAMHQEVRAHGVLVHQLNKDSESKRDQRPDRADLSGSAAWFMTPRNVFAVHREALWKEVADDEIEVRILKQSFGKFPLAVRFPWNPETGVIGEGRSATFVRSNGGGGGDSIDGFLEQTKTPASAAYSKERGKHERKRRRG